MAGFALALSVTMPARALPQVGVEATTDMRRRGLSWSGGRPAAIARASVPLGALTLAAEAAAARGSPRHGGADAVVDLSARYRQGFGPVGLFGGAVGHAFPGGQGRQDYAEIEGGADALVGPARITGLAAYAPRQRAIGGDNLHLRLDLAVGVIGTPLTLRAAAGHSSGSGDGRRAQRLRPRGSYADYMVGIDHVTGPLTLGLRLTGTNGGRRRAPTVLDRDSGTRIAASARIDL